MNVVVRNKMYQTSVLICVSLLLSGLLIVVVHAQEQSSSLQSTPLGQGLEFIRAFSGLPNADLPTILGKLIRLALSLVGIILFFIIIYSGLLWMTSGGDQEKVAKAKAAFMSAIIGVIIIIAAYSIVSFVVQLFQNPNSVNSPPSQNQSAPPPGG